MLDGWIKVYMDECWREGWRIDDGWTDGWIEGEWRD